MTGYLVPISKAKKQGSGAQAKNQRQIRDAAATARQKVADVASAAKPPADVPPGTPANKISERTMRLASPKVLLGGGALLATGAGGAYLYRRKRVEKSLSSMQHDYSSVMMRTS